MITELGLSNFKAFEDTGKIPIKPITLLFGPNSSGKSSIIQALVLLNQTFGQGEEDHRIPWMPRPSRTGSGLVPTGPLIDLGSFPTVLFKHDLERSMGITLEYDNRDEIHPRATRTKTRWEMSFRAGSSDLDVDSFGSVLEKLSISVTSNRRKPFACEFVGSDSTIESNAIIAPDGSRRNRRIGRRKFDWASLEDMRNFVDFALWERRRRHREYVQAFGDTDTPFDMKALSRLARSRAKKESVGDSYWGGDLLPDRFFRRPELIRVVSADLGSEIPDDADGFMPENEIQGMMFGAMRNLIRPMMRQIGRLSYIASLRAPAERQSPWINSAPNSVGVRGENAATLLRTQSRLPERVGSKFKQMGIPYTVRVAQLGNEVVGQSFGLELTDTRTNTRVSPVDVGIGVSQLLPIVIESLSSRPNILCIEAPEVHLHPRLQAEVMDLIIESSERGKQWIIETHSEMFMLRLKRRIREGIISSSEVSVLYVNPTERNGSTIRELELNEDGEFIDEWPDGFFEESYLEVLGN